MVTTFPVHRWWTPSWRFSPRRSAPRDDQVLAAAEQLEAEFSTLSEAQFRRKNQELRHRLKSGETLWNVVPEACALLRMAAQRTVGMRPFDVQLRGGFAMLRGGIAEMQTGEGKTLTATLPLYLRGLLGKGAHIATVNDYLAERDALAMRPVYERLGLSVGIIKAESSPDERRVAYAADITYGTAKEFGFDFLRDRLLLHRQALEGEQPWEEAAEQPVQRRPYFALVDEADSVLIDDARTPLVISALPGEAQTTIVAAYRWSAAQVSQFESKLHYTFDRRQRTVELTSAGRRLVRALARPASLTGIGLLELYEYLERALFVNREFHLQQHYVIRDGEIVIVDEATGRIAEGRKWSSGLHQAVEAKENVEVTVDAGQAARITVQDFFRRYPHLAGMTGTAATSRRELQSIYQLRVSAIPTHRPPRRRLLPDRLFLTATEKWTAIAEEVATRHATGQPVLVGTRTIAQSEILSELLAQRGLSHRVLNAHQVALEAEIVAAAGQPRQITVATNMAGRGTDIKLGPGVAELGGLHVICSELHESARIDRQLVGRCGRQGDPGTVQCFLSLEDEVLAQGLGAERAARLRRWAAADPARAAKCRTFFLQAQRRVEAKNYRQRKRLLKQEEELKKMHRELGQDPYLESPQ